MLELAPNDMEKENSQRPLLPRMSAVFVEKSPRGRRTRTEKVIPSSPRWHAVTGVVNGRTVHTSHDDNFLLSLLLSSTSSATILSAKRERAAAGVVWCGAIPGGRSASKPSPSSSSLPSSAELGTFGEDISRPLLPVPTRNGRQY